MFLLSPSDLLVFPIDQTQKEDKEQDTLLLSPYALVSLGVELCGAAQRVNLEGQVEHTTFIMKVFCERNGTRSSLKSRCLTKRNCFNQASLFH